MNKQRVKKTMSMFQKIWSIKFTLLVVPAILFSAFGFLFGGVGAGTAFAATIGSQPVHAGVVSPHSVHGGGCYNSGYDASCISVNSANQIAPDGYVTGGLGDCVYYIVLYRDDQPFHSDSPMACYAIGAHIVGTKEPATSGHSWYTVVIAFDGANYHYTYSLYQYT
jgi:hypothetical protein